MTGRAATFTRSIFALQRGSAAQPAMQCQNLHIGTSCGAILRCSISYMTRSRRVLVNLSDVKAVSALNWQLRNM